MEQSGLTLEQYLQFTGSKEEEFVAKLKEDAKRDEVKLVEENVLDKFRAFKFDVCNSKQIKRILSKLPKRNNSCESKNIELSVLLSIINLKCGGKDVILFHTDALFKEYVRCIANLIYRSIGDIS